MINKELKRAMANWVLDNLNEFQIYTAATKHFGAYIFDSNGNYLIGGQEISDFLHQLIDTMLEKGGNN